MAFTIHAACLCNTGRIRSNNEDNFFFNNMSLREENGALGTPLNFSGGTDQRRLFAIFDGMGGEAHGEAAAFAAARATYFASRKDAPSMDAYLSSTVQQINLEVFRAAQALGTDRMGATLAMISFLGNDAWVCNLGDSRIFRLQNGSFQQLSVDHTDEKELRARGIRRKPRLTQHLGIDPEEMLVEPYVARFPLASGDVYLVCSDGLTDMLTNEEIAAFLASHPDPQSCADRLVQAALARGGRDNVTVIVCRIQ